MTKALSEKQEFGPSSDKAQCYRQRENKRQPRASPVVSDDGSLGFRSIAVHSPGCCWDSGPVSFPAGNTFGCCAYAPLLQVAESPLSYLVKKGIHQVGPSRR